jgi:hypothetical protein
MVRIINNKDFGGFYTSEFIENNPDIVQDWVFTEVEPNSEFIKPTWNGSQWIEGATPQQVADYNALKVPKEVANMNFRLALIHFGIFPSIIDTAFAYMENSTEREEYIALWNTANTMERNNPKLINMALEFGINSTQLDEIFKYANTL